MSATFIDFTEFQQHSSRTQKLTFIALFYKTEIWLTLENMFCLKNKGYWGVQFHTLPTLTTDSGYRPLRLTNRKIQSFESNTEIHWYWHMCKRGTPQGIFKNNKLRKWIYSTVKLFWGRDSMHSLSLITAHGLTDKLKSRRTEISCSSSNSEHQISSIFLRWIKSGTHFFRLIDKKERKILQAK